jgi:hypothetical protein
MSERGRRTIGAEVEEFEKAHPLLLDGEFLTKYPGITDVSTFLDASSKRLRGKTGFTNKLRELGVTDMNGYLELIQQGNQEAINHYKRIKDICAF